MTWSNYERREKLLGNVPDFPSSFVSQSFDDIHCSFVWYCRVILSRAFILFRSSFIVLSFISALARRKYNALCIYSQVYDFQCMYIIYIYKMPDRQCLRLNVFVDLSRGQMLSMQLCEYLKSLKYYIQYTVENESSMNLIAP